ncbi:MAG: LicD family protein [Lachnospiraceae bacterium]|nr:LicD family protein [Lachnospiraceae bacterium]
METQHILDEVELKRVQAIELEMLLEVDRLCRKHGIHYNMVGGTMLGAIRHGGFIPWDDDADIAMLRTDYERFVQICETELDKERFYFQDIHSTDGYRWGYGKIRRKGTKFIRLGQEFMPYEQGIFIDIFPMDNVPDGWAQRLLHRFQCFVLRKELWSEVGKNNEPSLCKRFIYRLMSRIPRKKLIEKYDTLVDKYRDQTTEMVRILTFPAPKGTCGFYRKWYEEHADYFFEDNMLEGPADYEGWLTYKFGNYLELPPSNQQKTHPVSRIELPEEVH